MVAWTMYEEDVDSERMHLDEGRVYELNVVFDAIRRNAKRSGRGENTEATCRSKMPKQTPPVMTSSDDAQ